MAINFLPGVALIEWDQPEHRVDVLHQNRERFAQLRGISAERRLQTWREGQGKAEASK